MSRSRPARLSRRDAPGIPAVLQGTASRLRRRLMRQVRRGLMILLSIICMAAFSACLNTFSIKPTVWTSATETAQSSSGQEPTESAAETTQTTKPAGMDGDFLKTIREYGSLESGRTVRLPGGQWYDLTDAGRLDHIENLTIEADGTGLPTLSRYGETQQILRLESCSSVTFRNIRFGYNKEIRGEGNEANDLPLIELIGCVDITFENCSFFGGSAAGIQLNGSENIKLIQCEFYGLGGNPIKTGTSFLPSQMMAQACTFETNDSGPMPLFVRDSYFDSCDWIGANGYSIPVFNASQDPLVLAEKQWGDHTLPRQLDHVLAAKIDFHRDDNQAITIMDNFFASSEVTDLYDKTNKTLESLLPGSLAGWSLTGEKEEEAEPGAPLDPTLGLQITLRTTTPLIDVVDPVPVTETNVNPTESGSATSAEETESATSAGETESGTISTETLPVETTAPTEPMKRPDYTFLTLLQDLKPLQDLPLRIDSLITGALRIDLVNQSSESLLSCTMPVQSLSQAVAARKIGDLPAETQIVLWHDQFIPAEFFGDPVYGSLTANYLGRQLSAALNTRGIPCVLNPSADLTCFIDQIQTYQGTWLADGTAIHHFIVTVQRSESGTGGVARDDYPFAMLDILAGSGAMSDRFDGTAAARTVNLPSAEEKALILDTLHQTGTLQVSRASTGGGKPAEYLTLHALAEDVEQGSDYVPILIFTRAAGQIEVKIALYDSDYAYYPVLLVLGNSGETWQVLSADVIIEPAA